MNNTRNRPAFTLMELLVVIALIGILAGLAIYFVPSFQTSDRAARGGTDLQGWLNAARQRAIRDQAPRGLRLLFNGTHYDRAQYLEQPDDLGGARYYDSSGKTPAWINLQLRADPNAGGDDIVWVTDSNGKSAFNFGKNVLGRFSGADGVNFTDDDPPIQIADYLEAGGGGLAHYILNSKESVPKSGIFDMLVLYSKLPQTITNPISNFRIARKPRVTGEEVLEFPRSVVVDGTTNTTYADPTNFPLTAPFIESLTAVVGAPVDIMFAPNGSLMPGSKTKQHVVLWVRSTEYTTSYFEGEPTLIVVYANTGLVAAYPVNVGNVANPYDLMK